MRFREARFLSGDEDGSISGSGFPGTYFFALFLADTNSLPYLDITIQNLQANDLPKKTCVEVIIPLPSALLY